MTLKIDGEALKGDKYTLKSNKDMHKGKSLKCDGVH